MSNSEFTQANLQNCLNDLQDPVFHKPLQQSGLLKSVQAGDGEKATVQIELPVPSYPLQSELTESIRDAIQKAFPNCSAVEVEYSINIKGKQSGARLGLKVKNVIAVGAGKGGVGKSTVAASLAYGLKQFGARVGLVDADVYGPSIPHLVGTSEKPMAQEFQGRDGQTLTRIIPVEADGLKVMSMAFFVEPEQAVIWRGPMLHKAITQFLQDTEWGELDYLIIDMPPGTGDVSLTLSQLLELAGAVVVCTPQQVALLDAVKAVQMFRQVKIPVLGIVENMSGEIFGQGGAKARGEELQIPFLGEIPMNAEIREKSDAGQVSQLLTEDLASTAPLLKVAETTAIEIARTLLENPTEPALEIL
ncbi:Flagellum site-determining protein YlxH [Gimesia panareensis]|uniref:Iron-sulfur cluster carrier protein n=1 Tax=Gimesia panareensis TaxID=2527978 RepID=A0A518FVP7_9PLAN|nr:Mrp/NBP35 family ATP-binding protein [Gimesia panareensis]QDV20423.1 Flagellum site-determining protein YlxH [Gimesia panareensis]